MRGGESCWMGWLNVSDIMVEFIMEFGLDLYVGLN